jgi:hypothetical protein
LHVPFPTWPEYVVVPILKLNFVNSQFGAPYVASAVAGVIVLLPFTVKLLAVIAECVV